MEILRRRLICSWTEIFQLIDMFLNQSVFECVVLMSKVKQERGSAMKNAREFAGYIIGLFLFLILIPLLMWKLSGDVEPSAVQITCFIVMALAGISLSVWSIIYMRKVGKGNPMDAFNHEIAPRTSSLMKDGPYRICRNPMLLGVFIYYIGLLIFCKSWQAVLIFIIYFVIMMVQVNSEEKRLEQDFGEEYREYKKKTKKLIPYIW